MFGLTLEKLVLVAIVAGLVIGPQRLQEYAHTLARTVRSFRDLVAQARVNAETDLGVSLDRGQWESLNLRQYDPRRIVREALDEPSGAAEVITTTEEPSTASHEAAMTPEQLRARAELLEAAQRVRPGQKYLVSGDAAHPRRIRIDSLPADDPRRLAAELPTPDQSKNATVVEDIFIFPGEEPADRDGGTRLEKTVTTARP